MKVSTRVHYGLRAMTELARSYRQGRLLSISEIARNEALPVSYLEQLVGELRRAGLVEGTRGVHGGYRLAAPPKRSRWATSTASSRAKSRQLTALPRTTCPARAGANRCACRAASGPAFNRP